jgi:hypothetical protein
MHLTDMSSEESNSGLQLPFQSDVNLRDLEEHFARNSKLLF